MRIAPILFGIALLTASLQGQEPTDVQQQFMTNAAVGKEFYVVVPPNEYNPYATYDLSFYAGAAFDTKLTVTNFSSNYSYEKPIIANTIKEFHTSNGETNWTWEVHDFGVLRKRAIKFSADEAFTLSYINSKPFSTEGTSILPVSSWGTSYIITTYPDYAESRAWGGGFCVVASQNNTVVNITLRGRGGEEGQTQEGRKIGSTYSVTLDEGDVYCVAGDGATRTFDLTGTLVTSNVPIGVVNYHRRTTVPRGFNASSRDHLLEWAIPTSQWSNTYITTELTRDSHRPLGDLVRIVGVEPDTKWERISRDPQSGDTIQHATGVLWLPGDFHSDTTGPVPTTLVKGITEWKADKPIAIVQYSTSGGYDSSRTGDPFQINIMAEDFWTEAISFVVPPDLRFTSHTLQIHFRLDPDHNDVDELLEAMTLNGQKLSDRVGDLKQFNLPGTNIWSVKVPFKVEKQQFNLLTPGVACGAYLYGPGLFESYGLWLGGKHPNNIATDTMPPIANMTDSTNLYFDFFISDSLNLGSREFKPLSTERIDAGIARIELLNATNLSLSFIQPLKERMPEAAMANIRLTKVDPLEDGSGELLIWDYAGNESRIPVSLPGTQVPVIATTKQLHFGTISKNARVCSEAVPKFINNTGTIPLTIELVTINQSGSAFSFVDDVCANEPYAIAPADSMRIPCVCFSATSEGEHQAELILKTNDPRNETFTITMTGIVENPTTIDDLERGSKLTSFIDGASIVVSSATPRIKGAWRVIAVSGETVSSGVVHHATNQLRISTNHLASGVYFVVFDDVETCTVVVP